MHGFFDPSINVLHTANLSSVLERALISYVLQLPVRTQLVPPAYLHIPELEVLVSQNVFRSASVRPTAEILLQANYLL